MKYRTALEVNLNAIFPIHSCIFSRRRDKHQVALPPFLPCASSSPPPLPSQRQLTSSRMLLVLALTSQPSPSWPEPQPPRCAYEQQQTARNHTINYIAATILLTKLFYCCSYNHYFDSHCTTPINVQLDESVYVITISTSATAVAISITLTSTINITSINSKCLLVLCSFLFFYFFMITTFFPEW